MSSNRVKNTTDPKTNEIIAYSESAIRNNASAVEYCRTSMSALSGSTAGSGLDVFNCLTSLTLFIHFYRTTRHHGTDRYPGIPLLSGRGARSVAAFAAQVRIELAKVFHQSPESADERLPIRTLYVRAVLDVPVRNGSRVLMTSKCLLKHFNR